MRKKDGSETVHRLIVRHENGKRVLACENPRCELAADPKNKYRYTGMEATKRVLRRRSLGWSNGEWRIEKKEPTDSSEHIVGGPLVLCVFGFAGPKFGRGVTGTV